MKNLMRDMEEEISFMLKDNPVPDVSDILSCIEGILSRYIEIYTRTIDISRRCYIDLEPEEFMHMVESNLKHQLALDVIEKLAKMKQVESPNDFTVRFRANMIGIRSEG